MGEILRCTINVKRKKVEVLMYNVQCKYSIVSVLSDNFIG